MIFETHKLKEPLSTCIESVFHFTNFMPDHSIERVVPTGNIYILIELDNFIRNTYDNDTLKPEKTLQKVWISGMHRNYISISAHQNSEMLVIQFKPYGAYPFFHFPINRLNEKIIPSDEVFGNQLLILREEILKQNLSTEKLLIAENWLNSRFDHKKMVPQKLWPIIEKLQNEPVNRYQNIIELYSNTQKHLIDQFKKFIGLTPKYFQRIMRFNEILLQIQKKKHISWAQIAYQCGFSDQSHFIKEFKHFSGFNPQEFINEDYNQNMPNFFPLDKKG